MSLMHLLPSAIITARSVRTRPGSWAVCGVRVVKYFGPTGRHQCWLQSETVALASAGSGLSASTSRLPAALCTTPGTLFCVGVVVLASLGINNLTNGVLNTFVVALVFGIELRTLGIFKPSVLVGIDTLGLMMLAIMIPVFGPLATVKPSDVASLALPLVLVFLFGVAGIAGFSALVGKLLGYSIPMSISIGLTACSASRGR
jgi:hypothetical protein